MKKTRIQLKLLAAGITQQEIADATGISSVTVGTTIRGAAHNQAVQEHIAKVLHKAPEKLWGVNYAPVRRRRRRDANAIIQNNRRSSPVGIFNGPGPEITRPGLASSRQMPDYALPGNK